MDTMTHNGFVISLMPCNALDRKMVQFLLNYDHMVLLNIIVINIIDQSVYAVE